MGCSPSSDGPTGRKCEGAPHAERVSAGKESDRPKRIKRCYNCGAEGHILATCSKPKRSKFVYRADGATKLAAAVGEMHAKMKGTEDALREIREDKILRDLEAAKERGGDPPEKKKKEVEVREPVTEEITKVHWLKDDAESELMDLADYYHNKPDIISFDLWDRAGSQTQVALKFCQFDPRTLWVMFKRIFGHGLLFTCLYRLLRTFFRARAFQSRSLNVPHMFYSFGYLFYCVKIVGTARLIYWLVEKITEWAEKSMAKLPMVKIPNPASRYHQVEQLEAGVDPETDMRFDAVAAGDLTHPSPKFDVMSYQTSDNVYFGPLMVQLRTSREMLVSTELLTQNCSPANFLLDSKVQDAFNRIEYACTHTHSVNVDRTEVLNGWNPHMDTTLVAHGMYRQFKQERHHADFHTTDTQSLGSLNTDTGWVRFDCLPFHLSNVWMSSFLLTQLLIRDTARLFRSVWARMSLGRPCLTSIP